MRTRIGRLTHSQVIGTVFALTWATCPFVFAQERAKQEVKRVTREVVSRLVPAERVEPLLDQILSSQATIYESSTASGDTVTILERPEGTYTFENMTYTQDTPDAAPVFSGKVTLQNIGGNTNVYDLTRLTVIDHNRIDYAVSFSSTSAGVQEEAGSLIGVGAGEAIHIVSENGQNSTVKGTLNYSRISNPQQDAIAAAACEPTFYGDGGASAASGWGTVAVEPCTVLVVAVVITVAIILCYLFCWLLWP